MDFIPYSCQEIDEADIAAVIAALRSDFLTQGPRLAEFETRFAALHNAGEAVAVSNATAALHIGCLALGAGPGSHVWTTPNSFLASANCALYCGATIDFVDIDPITRNISVDGLRERLKAAAVNGRLPDIVIPVDFSGLPCDLREIRHLADQYGFRILQDASHATGASYLGAPVGSQYSDATVFSFHAVKIVTTAEGGMITTRDRSLANRLRLLRSHGMTRDPSMMLSEPDGPWYYEQIGLGFNYRMTDLQAALGLSQLDRLTLMHSRRMGIAERYDEAFRGLPLRLPARLSDRVSSWHLYAIELDPVVTKVTRADLFNDLRSAGIGVNVHYIPIHTQPHYRALGFKWGDFPASEAYYLSAISLPIFPRMTELQQDRVIDVIRRSLGSRG
jgi:UDP-4-amino-4,6-dideoxy-N-acetyl-beta-L-altrosamine transaminase